MKHLDFRRLRHAGAALALLLAAQMGLNAAMAGKASSRPVASPVLAADDAEVPGEVLVRLRSTADLQPLLIKHSLSLRSQFGLRPIYRLSVVGTATTQEVIDALGLEPTVLDAEPHIVHRSPEARKNSAWTLGDRSAYVTQWAPEAMRLPQAHAISQGAGVVVAVLDTGVDASHPTLAGRVLPGFDFVDFDTDPSEVGTVADISFGHGTHVAGLVALAAPAAQILPLRVLDAQGQGNAWVLAEAMLYAVDPDQNPATNDGAQVINMSLGSLRRTHLFDSIVLLAACAIPEPADPANTFTDPSYNLDRQRCDAYGGATVIAAAGNDASRRVRQYPAAEGAYGLLPVTASNPQRRLASFANHGAWVDLAAPGEGITSAVPGGLYGTWSGTSMAAPLVAGAAALLKAREPGLSARDVARRLERISAPLCDTQAQRLVDAEAALRHVVRASAPCP